MEDAHGRRPGRTGLFSTAAAVSDRVGGHRSSVGRRRPGRQRSARRAAQGRGTGQAALFDAYGVDLVVAGHEHHFERSFPVRGVMSGSGLLTPAPQGSDAALMDTSAGTVHMIIDGGGHSFPTPVADFDAPHDGVLITAVGPGSPQSPHASITTTEPAPWSAYRDLQMPHGFASFDVVPHERGGTTSITVTHFGAAVGSPDYVPLDQFVMRKRLSSRAHGGHLAGATATP